MIRIIKGMAWHVHHDELLEYVWNYQERADFIDNNKPAEERPLRRRLFQMVKGSLPTDVAKAGAAYAVYAKAGAAYAAAYDAAYAVYAKAGAAYAATSAAAYAVYAKAGVAYAKSRAAYAKAVQDNLPALLALHAQECPNCPWDGKTIFPEQEA